MKAVQLVRWQAEPELRERRGARARPGEVLVEVAAAGLCHSDLHVMEWPAGSCRGSSRSRSVTRTPAGSPRSGPGTAGVEQGAAVLVYGPWGCGALPAMRRGAENLCERKFDRPGAGAGLGFDGGLADYLLVPSTRLLVPLGELDPVAAAPLTDAALTPYHALKPQLGRLVPGSTVVVIGVGGLGHVAVQLLSRAVARADRRRRRPGELAAAGSRRRGGRGARRHRAPAAELRQEVGRSARTLVLDFVVTDQTLALAAAAIGIGGHVSAVGLGGGTFPMAFGRLPLEWSLGQTELGHAARAPRGRGAGTGGADHDRGRAVRARRGDRGLPAACATARSTGARWCVP